MLDFQILPVGPLACNCVLLWDAKAKTGVVVDPGDEAEKISKRVNKLGVDIQAILLTHAHFDHLGAAAELQWQWGCPVLLHPWDDPLLEHIGDQTASFGLPPIQKPNTEPLNGELPLGITMTHTPGHSPGSSSFLADSVNGKLVLCGDTLFYQGVGRTDFWGGSWETLADSIRTKLYTLAPDTIVLSGHGPKTTIGAERKTNPYIQG